MDNINTLTTQQTLDAQHVKVGFLLRSHPSEPANRQFEMIVPDGWRPENITGIATEWFRPIAQCVAPEGCDADITVMFCEVSEEINAADWLDLAWKAHKKVEVLERRETLTVDGVASDLTVRCHRETGSSLCRSVVFQDAHRIFRVDARAAEDVFPRIAAELHASISSFALTHAGGPECRNTRRNLAFPSPLPFELRCPTSWSIDATHTLASTCIVELRREVRGQTAGRITVEVHCRAGNATATSLASGFANRLRNHGAHVSGAPLRGTQPIHGFASAFFFAPDVRYKGHLFDAPVLIFEDKRGLVLLALTGPCSDEAPDTWAINKRAFEIVRDSLRVGDEAELA